MSTQDEEDVIARVLADGSMAASLLSDGSPFLTFVERLQEEYKEEIFTTAQDESERRELIYTRMKVLDDLIHTMVMAQHKGNSLANALAEENKDTE